MKQVSISPERIIGLNDYPPLHSPEALVKYFELFKNGEYSKMVPVPLVPIAIVLPYLVQDQKFRKHVRALEKFISTHHVEYFQLDGKHRASGAYLAKRKIIGIVIENESDVTKAKALKDSGKFGIEDTIEDLKKHLLKHPINFWTVAEKTEAMIADGAIPQYMTDYLRK